MGIKKREITVKKVGKNTLLNSTKHTLLNWQLTYRKRLTKNVSNTCSIRQK